MLRTLPAILAQRKGDPTMKKPAKKAWDGWIDLGSDVCWEDHGGMWGFKAPDASWYVIRFENAEDWSEGEYKYHCDLSRVVLCDLPVDQIKTAMSYCGYTWDEILSWDTTEAAECALVYACVSAGSRAPLDQNTSNGNPERLRVWARKEAEDYIRSEARVRRAMSKPVNAVGSTAEEYMQGDLDSWKTRYLCTGEQDPKKDLMLKLTGLPRKA